MSTYAGSLRRRISARYADLSVMGRQSSTERPGSDVSEGGGSSNSLEERRQQQADALRDALKAIQSSSLRYQTKLGTDADGNVIWSQSRIKVGNLVMTQKFETIMGCVIVFNLCCMVFETNQDALCYPDWEHDMRGCPHNSSNIPWMVTTNLVLLVVYTMEAALRIYVERTQYFLNKWNQLDMLTVSCGWLTTAVESFVNMNFLRVFRVARLLRAARVLVSIREFYLLMSGFMSSIRAIFFGAICLLCTLVLWAIFMVQTIHPINASIHYEGCDRCSVAYLDVQSAVLTLTQQIVAGDSWGMTAIPIVEKEPVTFFVLFTVLIFISLGVMNLILAVIVERSTEARENDVEAKLAQKDAVRSQNMVNLCQLCHQMDQDGSGTLSLEEMLLGCEQSKEFRQLMDLLDLQKADLATIFKALDEDGSGDVSYIEFCQNIDSATRRDPQMMVSLIKFSMSEIKTMVQKDVIDVLADHSSILEQVSGFLEKHGFKREDPEASSPRSARSNKSSNSSVSSRKNQTTRSRSRAASDSNELAEPFQLGRAQSTVDKKTHRSASMECTVEDHDLGCLYDLSDSRSSSRSGTRCELLENEPQQAMDRLGRELEQLLGAAVDASATAKAEELVTSLLREAPADGGGQQTEQGCKVSPASPPTQSDSSAQEQQQCRGTSPDATAAFADAKRLHQCLRQRLSCEEAVLARKRHLEQRLGALLGPASSDESVHEMTVPGKSSDADHLELFVKV
eukprot:TRINITY_DN102951_c0_g1_i1.p1 TRINITY_DN102951_c0_g1~~TRINITY_DN102951_c0_g1_i1.p1  ORF type:complete len:748 (+),score=172.31 TRINITY_DN102951_c0_g1_i1:33-2246(+)